MWLFQKLLPHKSTRVFVGRNEWETLEIVLDHIFEEQTSKYFFVSQSWEDSIITMQVQQEISAPEKDKILQFAPQLEGLHPIGI